MKKKIYTILFIFVVIGVLAFARQYYSDYNKKRIMSACVLALKKSNKTFTPEESIKICEININKKINN